VIDSHCHLADDVFAGDLDEVVLRARQAELRTALCILAAGDEREARQADRLVALWPAARLAVGVHPHQAGEFADRSESACQTVREAIEPWSRVVGIGEIGLDYHYDFAPRSVQRAVFSAQVHLARSLALPVIIHTREADDDTLAILASEGGGELSGVFHCFTGDDRLAQAALDLGFLLSFSGIVTFPRADALRATVRQVPDDRLLVETDSPFLAPVPNRGRRNEPAWVVRTAEALAAVRGVSLGEISEITDRNFTRLFGDVPIHAGNASGSIA
jgi:TatD DNase family protein